MPLFHLNLFGDFQLSTPEYGHINISAKKAKALLTYLALQPNRLHQRERIATLLWEEYSATQARHNLRQAVSTLRKVIPDVERLIAGDQQSLQLLKEFITVDALNFDKLCNQNGKASLQQAYALYRGELLEGLYTGSKNFDDWLEIERSHRREKILQVMDRLLQQAQSEGKLEQVIRLGIKITALDPLREATHRILMDAYHQQGRRGSALKQYRLCQQLLRNELGIAPENETQALHQAIFHQQKSFPDKQTAPISGPDHQREDDESEKTSPSEPVNQLHQVSLLSVQIHTADTADNPESQFHRHQHIARELKKSADQFDAAVVEMQNGSLLVLFGLPSARTNDTEMAIRVGFAMLGSLDCLETESSNCSIKIGISSGQIYILDSKPDDLQPQSLSGSTLQQTMMLADLAQPGQILIANRAYATIASLVTADEMTDTDNIDHKSIWRLVEMNNKNRQPSSSLVGRQFELQQFITAARGCVEADSGQLILVRGEPGIGKTRLLQEWQELASDLGFDAHSVSVFDFGTTIGQNPLQILIRSLLQINSTDSLSAVKARSIKSVDNSLLRNEQLNFLYDILNVPDLLIDSKFYQAMDQASRDAGKQEILNTLVQYTSNNRPLLLIVEDIHWAESALLRVLGQLVVASSDFPVILVFSTRAEGEPSDPVWRSQIQSTSLMTLDLRPLRYAEAAAMVSQTVNLPENESSGLIQRAGGNPLFLEQLLICAQQTITAVPDSVQSIIAAKLDTLDTFDKHAAFAASILGQKFSLNALKFILDNPDYQCSELITRGIVKPDGTEFLFHHALILEGIYTIQLPSQRRSLHLLAARWYKNTDSVLYAQHLDKAESDQAAEAYLTATEHLIELYQYDGAEKLARRGREIATKTTIVFDLSVCHADILRELGRTQASLNAFLAAEQQAPSPKQQCQALVGQGYALRLLDRHHEVLSLMKKIEPLAEPLHDIKTLASLYYLRGNACFFLGLIDDCLIAHQQAEKLASIHNLPFIQARALSGIADAYYARGRLITAESKFRQSVALFKQHGYHSEATSNQVMIAAILGYLNRSGDGEKMILETLEWTKKVRNRRAEAMALDELAFTYCQRNETDSARLYSKQCLQLAKEIGSARMQCDALLYLGIIDKNTALLEQAYGIATAHPFGKFYITSWTLAVIASVTDDPKKREWALQEGESLLSDKALSHNHLMFYRYAIESCLTSKQFDQARYFMNALERYTATEPLPWSEFFIKRADCLIRSAQGQTGKALENDLNSLITQATQVGLLESRTCLVNALQQIQSSINT